MSILHTKSTLTLFLEAISLPVGGPGCRDIGTRLELLDETQHGLVAKVQGYTTGLGLGVKPRPLTRAHDNFHVALEGVDVSSEPVVFLGATDLQQELKRGLGHVVVM